MMDLNEACLEVAKALEPLYGTDDKMNSMITFSLGNAIFRCPSVHMGQASPKCKYLPKTSKLVTEEHIFSRKTSAIDIIKGIRKGWSDKRLLTFIRSRCRVTTTLRTENMMLKPFQQDTKTHPRKIYIQAGIPMTPWIGPKWYNVEGKDYHVYDRESLAEQYGIPTSQLSYRISSKSPKWKDWTMVKA